MHLSIQRNDAVDSIIDCRRKYIVRYLFRKFISQSRLSSGYSSEISKLFCYDLRPSNVLVNKDFKIIAVINWEFIYVAPADFVLQFTVKTPF
jgi:hypothetical protein